jgi:hemoglobin
MPFRIARTHRDAWLRAMRIALDEAAVAPAHRDRLWGHLETVASNLTTHDTPTTLRMR